MAATVRRGQRCQRDDQARGCDGNEPATRGQTEVPFRAVADLIQPRHLFRDPTAAADPHLTRNHQAITRKKATFRQRPSTRGKHSLSCPIALSVLEAKDTLRAIVKVSRNHGETRAAAGTADRRSNTGQRLAECRLAVAL
jgi:hypothetical protein